MHDSGTRHDRLAVRLSLIISRLMQGESLSIKGLSDEFGVSERTLQRDFHQRLVHLDIEVSDGWYRLKVREALKVASDTLTFIRNTGLARIFPAQDDSQLISLLSGKPNVSPCLIWLSPINSTAVFPDCFSRLIQAITQQTSISLLSQGRRYSALEPYRMIYLECEWYLVACQQGTLQVFPLTEIGAVTLTTSVFQRRDDIHSLTSEEGFIATLPHFSFINNLIHTFR